MTDSCFVYVTYIRTTPEKLWQALIDPEFTKKYWMETWQECEWKKGATWKLKTPDGRIADHGEVVEIDRHKRLVLTWQHTLNPNETPEAHSRMTYMLDPEGDLVKFTIRHESDVPNSKTIKNISNGWPMFISSLKSMLETGEPLESTRKWPKALSCGG